MSTESKKRLLSSVINPSSKQGVLLRLWKTHGYLYDNYVTPRNFAPTLQEQFNGTDPDVGTGVAGSRITMHRLRLQIKVEHDTRKILDVSYVPFGCPSLTVCSSIASDWIKGKKIEEALQFKDSEFAKFIRDVRSAGCSLQKFHYTPLVDEAIQAAIKDYELKRLRKFHYTPLVDEAIQAAIKKFELKYGKLPDSAIQAATEKFYLKCILRSHNTQIDDEAIDAVIKEWDELKRGRLSGGASATSPN